MEIRSKIRGVTYKDPRSGKPRQQIIRQHVRPGMLLDAIFEPDNPHGDNAIGLWATVGQERYHIGYIGTELSEKLGPMLRKGEALDVYVTDITGRDKRTLGVNIIIRNRIGDAVAPPPAPAVTSAQSRPAPEHGCMWYVVRIAIVLVLLLYIFACLEGALSAPLPLPLFVVLVCLGMVLQGLG